MRASASNHFTKWKVLVATFESMSEAGRLAAAIEGGDDIHQASISRESPVCWTVYMRNAIPLRPYVPPDGTGP